MIPKLHPSLGKYAKEIGPYEARRALALLEQAKKASRQEIESIPEELRPVEYLQVRNILGRLLQGRPTDELRAYEEQRRSRIDKYWESRGTTAEARMRQVDALTERRITANALVRFLKPKLVAPRRAAKRETSAEGISDKQHRDIQRRDEEANEEAERFLKETGQKAERRRIQKGERR